MTCTPALSSLPGAAAFAVAVEGTTSPVTAGDPLTVSVNVTNVGTVAGTHSISLTNFSGTDVGTTALSLNASESRQITLDWVTSDTTSGSGNVTIRTASDSVTTPVTVEATEDPTPPSDTAAFAVTIESTTAPVTAGNPLSVTANVTNTGSAAGTQTITLENFAGTQVASQSITLDSADATTVTLTWQTEDSDAGSGTLAVTSDNDTATKTAEITNAVANVTLVNATVSERTITAGDRVYINATVTNTGTRAGNTTLGFYRNETILTHRTVNVSAGSTRIVWIEQPFTTAGTYNLTVRNQSNNDRSIQAGSVDVSAEQTESGTTTPGFGIVIAIVALLGAIVIRRRH